MSATIHSDAYPPEDRPSDGEVIIRLDCESQSAPLSVGHVEGASGRWLMDNPKRTGVYGVMLSNLWALIQRVEIPEGCGGVFHLGIDSESGEVTDVWAVRGWLKDEVDESDIHDAVSVSSRGEV